MTERLATGNSIRWNPVSACCVKENMGSWWVLPLVLVVAGHSEATEIRESAASSTVLTADEIIARAVELAEHLREQDDELRYQFLERATIEQFDAAGRVKQREEVLSEVYPLAGALYREVVERDGNPLSPKQLAKERRRKEEIRGRRARGEEKDEDRVRFNRELVDRYRPELMAEQVIRGRPTYAVRFEPKSDSLPIRRRIDYALNKSHGKIFVDKETFQVARVEFQLIKPVRLWWGLLGKLRAVQGVIERAPLPDGSWVGQGFDFSMNMRIFFRSIHTRRRATFRDHRLAEPTSAESESGS